MSEDELKIADLSKSGKQTVVDGALTRRQFIATTAAATGTLVLSGAAGFAADDKNSAKKSYDWKKLQGSLKGDCVTVSSPNFAEVTSAMVWNDLKPDRAPDVIVRVKNTDDVIAAVNFARENGLKVTTHGGGHNWLGLAVRNGGMIIDVTALNECVIDAAAKKATVQPVISNREVLKKLGEQGLSFPVGHCPTVKMSGYLLNGGFSWNMAKWGLAVESVENYEFVTADGKLINANDKEHQDLYWAARGCGPGMFAVAVKYHLKCYDLPKAIVTSAYWYHLDDLKEVVEKVTDIAYNMPEIVELSIFMAKAPDDIADKCKSTGGWVCTVAANAFADTEAEGNAALMTLDDATLLKKCLKKNVRQPITFDGLSDASGASWPEHTRNVADNSYSDGKPVAMYMALKEHILKAPSPKSVIVFVFSTGKKKLLPVNPNIACAANGNYYGGTWAIWEHEKDDAANIAWQLEAKNIMAKHVSGWYIGETDYVKDRSHIKGSFTQAKFKRLEEVRAKYDPTGVFQGFAGGLPPAKAT